MYTNQKHTVGQIIEGSKVALTCTVQGGNPIATITWSCDGTTQTTQREVHPL